MNQLISLDDADLDLVSGGFTITINPGEIINTAVNDAKKVVSAVGNAPIVLPTAGVSVGDGSVSVSVGVTKTSIFGLLGFGR